MVIDVKLEHLEKASFPILETEYTISFISMDDGISKLPEYEAVYCSLYVTSAVFFALFRL